MKKKLWNKLLSLAIMAAMCAALCIPAAAATIEYIDYGDGIGGGNGILLLVSLDQDTIYVSDEDQYVTATVTLSEEVQLAAFQINFNDKKTSPFEITSIDSERARELFVAGWQVGSVQNACFYGNTLIGPIMGMDYMLFAFGGEAGALCTCTYKIPAGTEPGTYELGAEYGSRVLDGDINRIVLTDVSITKTLTILEAPEEEVIDATGAALSQESVSLAKGGSTTLTASLQPADTTDTIANIAWTTSDASVATVADGKVTAVGAGEATITAKVTTEAGKVFTADCAVAVNESQVDSPYTVTIARDGESVVHVGDTVTMDVTVTGGAFKNADIQVQYDPDVFEYIDIQGKASLQKHTGNTLNLDVPSITGTYDDGICVATLSFKAVATGTGTFGFKHAQVCDPNYATNVVCPFAATEAADVEVTEQHTVTFLQADGTPITSVQVDNGAAVTDVPVAPAVDFHTFTGWTAGDKTYTTDEVKAQAVTADVTYTAAYAPNAYTVTLPAGVTDVNGETGAVDAVYGADFTAQIADYDANTYDYTVTYQVADGEAVTVTVAEDGTFTIPGTAITGDVTVAVKKLPTGLTVNIYQNYVTGYTLVTVSGPAKEGYSYDGNGMFYVEAYEAYAWLVADETGLTAEQAAAAVTVGGEHDTIAAGCNVNGDADGIVDVYDKQYTYDCYTLAYSVEDNMRLYLSSDVNATYKVDADDIQAVVDVIFANWDS